MVLQTGISTMKLFVLQYYHLYVNSSGDFMIQYVDKNNFGFENMNYNMINFHPDIQ